MNPLFEEKTFESYFNNELSQKTAIYFPFGQVQEGVIGLDSAAFADNWQLWNFVGWPYPLGVCLKDIADEMERHLSRTVSNIPPMKVNLLFQYKRPDFITRPNGSEWDDWKQPYFRYDLYAHQHALLEHLENRFGNSALILYASPAIKSTVDLIALMQKRAIIGNTNFRKASELNGHHRNTYIAAGTYSRAYSEPIQIANFDLLELLAGVETIEQRGNQNFLMAFAKGIREAMKTGEYYRTSFENRLRDFQELERFKLLFSLLTMRVFREITGTQWMVALTRERQ